MKSEKMALTQDMKKLIKSCLNQKNKRQKWKFFAPECQNVKMVQGNGATQSLKTEILKRNKMTNNLNFQNSKLLEHTVKLKYY